MSRRIPRGRYVALLQMPETGQKNSGMGNIPNFTAGWWGAKDALEGQRGEKEKKGGTKEGSQVVWFPEQTLAEAYCAGKPLGGSRTGV